MNIFAIHHNPVRSARELHDKHVVKMILESAQMLANALGNTYGNGLTPLITKRLVPQPGKLRFHLNALCHPSIGFWLVVEQLMFGRIFGWDSLGRLQFSTRGYHSHPCTVWVRESQDNLNWLVVHGLALCCEYRKRYGKTHSLHKEFARLVKLVPKLSRWKRVTSFARAMPDELKYSTKFSDTEAYRLYLKNHKPWYTKGWKRSPMPNWLTV